MFTLHGTGIGSGIAIGKARIIKHAGETIPLYSIEKADLKHEVSRLTNAINQAREKLIQLQEELDQGEKEEISAFVEAHLLMLDDPILKTEPVNIILREKINAEAAIERHAVVLKEQFDQIGDPYLSSKYLDVAQVINRIQGELMEEQGELTSKPEGEFDGEIIVTHDLSPSDTIDLKRHQIQAFLTNLGGPTSHTAILARSMKIPAVVGLHGSIKYLRTGDLLVIDGRRGVVLVNPDQVGLASYERRREKILRRKQELELLRDADTMTLDGHKIRLMANIEMPEEIGRRDTQSAAGVGLYRTEFLYMNREAHPDENEQFEVYKEVVEKMAKPVIIRTLDLGADKQIDGGRGDAISTTNPALGLRAIRLCLHDLSLFKPQLRALYRASAFGDLKIMIPMVCSTDELNQVFSLLDQVKHELIEEGFDINENMPVGGMIEVPAAAISADLFADRLDFFSIGTNDLIQYTLAIDRIDDEVNYLYDPLHPSVLRLIQHTIRAANSANIPVSMCGEMAGDITYTRVLLGMGLKEFSMDPATILEVKQQIRMTDISRMADQIDKILNTGDRESVKSMVEELNA